MSFLGCTPTIQNPRLSVAVAAPPGQVTLGYTGFFVSCGEQRISLDYTGWCM